MNEDYLWDRTGEPDPEIEKLERELGQFRYQPRPLEIPAGMKFGRRKFFYPALAVAAAILMLVLGAGLWLRVRNAQPANTIQAGKKPLIVLPATNPKEDPTNAVAVATPEKVKPAEQERSNQFVAGVRGNPRSLRVHQPELTAAEIAQGQAAKQQLMLALRLTSAKLAMAQKRTQGGYPSNLIRNQHRVG